MSTKVLGLHQTSNRNSISILFHTVFAPDLAQCGIASSTTRRRFHTKRYRMAQCSAVWHRAVPYRAAVRVRRVMPFVVKEQ